MSNKRQKINAQDKVEKQANRHILCDTGTNSLIFDLIGPRETAKTLVHLNKQIHEQYQGPFLNNLELWRGKATQQHDALYAVYLRKANEKRKSGRTTARMRTTPLCPSCYKQILTQDPVTETWQCSVCSAFQRTKAKCLTTTDIVFLLRLHEVLLKEMPRFSEEQSSTKENTANDSSNSSKANNELHAKYVNSMCASYACAVTRPLMK